MRFFAGLAGFVLIAIILGDAFETIVLPRRVRRRIRFTRLFYHYTWLPWRNLVVRLPKRRRETWLGFFGPLSLIFLLLSWAIVLIVAFALLQWAGGMRLSGNLNTGFGEALYFSGTTFTTLGLGDVTPTSPYARLLAVGEAGTGFGFLAMVIGYLPIIYQAFSRRESHITLLDARAGSPPAAGEMLRRYAEARALEKLGGLLAEFDRWAAELLESHISYPVLALFRSQHNNESWLAALTAILDVCALLLVGVEDTDPHQAWLTFAMSRHVAVDLAQVLKTPPTPPPQNRLPDTELARLRLSLAAYGAKLRDGPAADAKLAELRRLYEPYVCALANHLVLDLPPWFAPEGAHDNWQTSAWERVARRIPLDSVILRDDHL
jgi:ABC-type multidrug transport system fused ATPase/permease subunit